MEIISQLALIILLVLLNGFFVASEFALVTARKTRIDQMVKRGNTAAKFVQKALENLDKYISATQLGVTLTSLILGWIGEPVLAHHLESFFSFLPRNGVIFSSHAIAVLVTFAFITFLDIVIGELVPKAIALGEAEIVSLIVIAPLTFFSTIFRPFILSLNKVANLILRLLHFESPSNHELVQTEEDIKMILDQSSQSGLIPALEAEMIQNVFRLRDIPIKQMVIPKTDIVAFNIHTKFKDLVKMIDRSTHSRFPVYDRFVENIIGFIHIKDVYKSIIKMEGNMKLSQIDLMRGIISVPETKKANEVLLDMRRKHVHLAVVYDEFGGTIGMVTLEDIIESFVGEIQDEFDRPIREIKRNMDGSYIIDGSTSIMHMEKRFKLPMRNSSYTTVGGLVFGLLGREPMVGDKVQIENSILEVTETDRKRIKKIRLKKEVKRDK